MINPLKKQHDELTTADIADRIKQPSEAEIQDGRQKLVQSERG